MDAGTTGPRADSIANEPTTNRGVPTRVAATPETVKKLAASGKHEIVVEAGAGVASSITDADFQGAGARIADAAAALGADIGLKVRGPAADELPRLKRGALPMAWSRR